MGDARDNVLDESFFDVEPSNFVIPDSSLNVPGYTHAGEAGVLIKLKAGYKVKGKIVLPKAINGVKVRGLCPYPNGIAGSKNAPNTEVTAVLWEEGATPEVYTQSCLADCTNLMYVEFPPSVYNIETQAFLRCKLQNRDLLSALNLREIASSAFNEAFGVTSNKKFIIPGWITILQALCFAYNNNRSEEATAINSWQIGEQGNPTQLMSLPGNITSSTNPFAPKGTPYLEFIIYTPAVMNEVIRSKLEQCVQGTPNVSWPLGE